MSTRPPSTPRPRRANDKAGIIDLDMPIHVSNVMLVHKGKPVPRGLRGPQRQEGPRGEGRRRHDRGHLMSDTRNPAPKVFYPPSSYFFSPQLDAPTAPESECHTSAEDEVPRRHQGQPAGAARPRQRHAGPGHSSRSSSTWVSARPPSSPRCWRVPSPTSRLIAGQKPIVTKAKTLHRWLQAHGGPGHRHQGHAARRPHVGVPGPAHRRRHPPHPGLPRPPADVVGRAGQLHVRPDEQDRSLPRSITTRSTTPTAWTSRSSPQQPRMQPARPCWTPSVARFPAGPTRSQQTHRSSAEAAVVPASGKRK